MGHNGFWCEHNEYDSWHVHCALNATYADGDDCFRMFVIRAILNLLHCPSACWPDIHNANWGQQAVANKWNQVECMWCLTCASELVWYPETSRPPTLNLCIRMQCRHRVAICKANVLMPTPWGHRTEAIVLRPTPKESKTATKHILYLWHKRHDEGVNYGDGNCGGGNGGKSGNDSGVGDYDGDAYVCRLWLWRMQTTTVLICFRAWSRKINCVWRVYAMLSNRTLCMLMRIRVRHDHASWLHIWENGLSTMMLVYCGWQMHIIMMLVTHMMPMLRMIMVVDDVQ